MRHVHSAIDSELVLTGSHWGTFRARARNGRVVEIVPFERDPSPTPMLAGLGESYDHPTRVRRPAVTISFSTGSELVRSDAVKALAVSTEHRLPAFPDVPTFKQLGYKDMVSGSWFALSGPAHLPDQIVQKLNREVMAALMEPAIQQNLEHAGFDTRPMSPAEVTAFVETESARWVPIATAAAAQGK
jgi:hypothetical protein